MTFLSNKKIFHKKKKDEDRHPTWNQLPHYILWFYCKEKEYIKESCRVMIYSIESFELLLLYSQPMPIAK